MQNHLALEAHILSILDFIINNAQEDILNFLILDQGDKITDFDFQVNPKRIALSFVKESGFGFLTKIVLNLKDEYTVDNIGIFDQYNFSSIVKEVQWKSNTSLVSYIYRDTNKIETLWGYGGSAPFGSYRFSIMKNIILEDVLSKTQFNRITEFLTNTLKSIGKE